MSKPERLTCETADWGRENIKKLLALFPECACESGQVDFDKLKQVLTSEVLEGDVERYQFTWPGKRKAMAAANAKTTQTLRPYREESVNFDATENLYIEGDNLEALKLLQAGYAGKVKMIYIDPPYNTGKDFVYRDRFSLTDKEVADVAGAFDAEGNRYEKNDSDEARYHTNWCNMMYPRLKLARELLSDDGVIFISIDDNEVENVKKICNEIFDQKNFVGMLSVENNPKGRKNSEFISVSSEYCLIFAKNKTKSYFIENVPKKSNDMVLDENGRYVHNSGKRVLVGENSFNKIVTSSSGNKNYSVYFRKRDYSVIFRKESFGEIDQKLVLDGYVKYFSHYKGKLVENTYTEEKFLALVKEYALSFSEDKIYEKNFKDTVRMKSQLVNREYEAIVHGQKTRFSMELTTTGAGTYLKELFALSDVPFTAPKNVGFLKMLVSLLDKNDFYVLDFFSGSASLADAVMQLNAEDGGNRKFILVQLPEATEEKSEAYAAGYKTICEIGKERIRRAGKKIQDENPLTTKDLDVGFRVLKIDSSSINDVAKPVGEQTQEFNFETDRIKTDRSSEDLLFQVLLQTQLPLSESITRETICGNEVFTVGGVMMACLDAQAKLTEEFFTVLAQRKPDFAFFRDDSFADDNARINLVQIFKQFSTDSKIKVL